jgi:membrane-bound lytic murein transglycosylase B
MPHLTCLRWLVPMLAAATLVPRLAAQSPAPPAAPPPAAATGQASQAVSTTAAQSDTAPPPPPFTEWLADLRAEAAAKGFSDDILRRTIDGLEPLPQVIRSDRSQAELNPGFRRYLSTRLTRPMVRRGREQAQAHRSVLDRVESTFEVQRRFLLSIWGLETRYGRVTGRTPVFRALATLAWEPRRAAYFRGELFNALTMVSRGHIEPASMTGSWAGAMGQTQFMPSSYLAYAVDADGDGRRDIWRSTADALGSIASYLKGYGWNGAQTWGREVRVPAGARAAIEAAIPKRPEGCYAIRNMTTRVPLDEWRRLGVTLVDGGRLPVSDIPAGLVNVGDRDFLVYPNYDAILGYNCAHYYALTVALLADALR